MIVNDVYEYIEKVIYISERYTEVDYIRIGASGVFPGGFRDIYLPDYTERKQLKALVEDLTGSCVDK